MNVYLWTTELDNVALQSTWLDAIHLGTEEVWSNTPKTEYELVVSSEYWTIWHNITDKTFIISRHLAKQWTPDSWEVTSVQDYVEIADHNYWADSSWKKDYYLFASDITNGDGTIIRQFVPDYWTKVDNINSVVCPTWYHIPEIEELQYLYRLVVPILWALTNTGWSEWWTGLMTILNMANTYSKDQIISDYNASPTRQINIDDMSTQLTKSTVIKNSGSSVNETAISLDYLNVYGVNYTDYNLSHRISSSTTWYVRLFKDTYSKEAYAWCYSIGSYPVIIHSDSINYPWDTNFVGIYEEKGINYNYDTIYLCRHYYASQWFNGNFVSNLFFNEYWREYDAYDWRYDSIGNNSQSNMMIKAGWEMDTTTRQQKLWVWIFEDLSSSWGTPSSISLPLNHQPSNPNLPVDWYLYIQMWRNWWFVTLSEKPISSQNNTIWVDKTPFTWNSIYKAFMQKILSSKFLWLIEKSISSTSNRNWSTAMMFWGSSERDYFVSNAYNSLSNYSPAWFDFMSTREDILYSKTNIS